MDTKVSVLPVPYTAPQRRTEARPRTGSVKALKYLLLLSVAAILSTFLPFFRSQSKFTKVLKPLADPEWKDDVWPIREHTPWDISTDYAYPRVLEYDVTEGTWLRLDVKVSAAGGAAVTARPVLLGVPYDSNPTFSPTGTALLWVKPWSGCVDRGSQAGQRQRLDGAFDEHLLSQGIKETNERRVNRLIREGRHDVQRVTNETYRWLSEPRFHPDGTHLIATKWYTSSRSLGAGEGWKYAVPEPRDNKTIAVGSGTRVLGRTLPRGWTNEQYGDQQIGPEQFIWRGEDSLKTFTKAYTAIFSFNITTQSTETLVDASPGGASRPELSPDGRTLAFVRRDRDHELLGFGDLGPSTIFGMGLHTTLLPSLLPWARIPPFLSRPSGDAVIIWAAGQIYSVPITTNSRGERIRDPSRTPTPIRFKAHIEKRLAETVKGTFDLVGAETAATQRAAGVDYVQPLGKASAIRVPVLDSAAAYYSPEWVPGDDLIIHGRWSNTNFTTFEVADLASGKAYEVAGLPLGRYHSAVVCECSGSHRRIAFLKTGGDRLTGEINKKLLVQHYDRAFIIDLESGPSGVAGTYSHLPVASGRDGVAFVEGFHVYFVAGDKLDNDEAVWAKPANATAGLTRLSLDGGHAITWSPDGTKLFWFLGPYLHSLECASKIEHDTTHFGISCVKDLLEYQEVVVEHSTDIARLKKRCSGTQRAGQFGLDLIREGVLTIRGGVIESVGALGTLVPSGVTAYNAQGGFIDVHAHWDGVDAVYPATSWELEGFLAYGVTTLHNPSTSTVESFDQRSRVESGQLVDIVDDAEAYSALLRLRLDGGIGSISYKNYNLPVRASRQRLLNAARNLTMLCVPEGGMNFDWDLTYIIDGMTTLEHALPVPVLFDDVLTLFALSGTGYTPTHIVNYGGAWGEQYVWATEDVPNNPKLRSLGPHALLNIVSESTARPKHSYQLFNTSASAAKMVHKGLKINIGAHGENPYGVNYHAEMKFTQQGGLTNYETLRAATSDAAITLGLFSSLGSLSKGKLADLIVYPPGIDLLEGDISQTRELRLVAIGGRFWDATSLEEVWPLKGKKQVLPPINAD
ncbi:hypothetical protein B0H14DRAFT_3081659 [Mycena olivaceomarginata]|nr:hypothetical protein B0H14DRAFT_3081659 [Mycena olivaceomarginata]